jgi:hypothetical protein
VVKRRRRDCGDPGRLTSWCANAAVYPVIAIEQLSDEDLDHTPVNLKAGFWFIKNRRHLQNRAVAVFCSLHP